MKKTLILLIASWYLLRPMEAQTAVNPTATMTGHLHRPATKNIVGYQIGKQGANYRDWQKIVKVTDADNNFTLQTNLAYIELADGLNYFSGGKWIPSKEQIESYPGGAIARQGQYQVIFANNLNSVGAIDLQTPDGKELKSHVLGLGYYDSSCGKTVLIAQIKNCQGHIAGSNQVIYADAFKGVSASVCYTYRRGSFEQDVILQAQPPTPESFGLNSASTVLQVLTEFDAAPAPAITAITHHSAVLADELLNFGAMRMVPGRAFMAGQNPLAGVRVGKQWLKVNGRTVLVESEPVSAITNQLNELPATHQTSAKAKNSILYMVSTHRLLPTPKLAKATKARMKLASLTPKTGLVLDYITEVNLWNGPFTFRSDTTYYITGSFGVTGTMTIEGGTVIKFAEGNYGPNGGVGPLTTFKCETSEYRPAIITSKNDNSVGETISGSTGHPNPSGYNCNALNFNVTTIDGPVQYLHLRYAAIGLTFGDSPATVRHCQFLNVGTGIQNYGSGTIPVENCLFSGTASAIGAVFDTGDVPGSSIDAVQLTIDNATALATAQTPVNVTNSILSRVASLGPTPSGDNNAFYQCTPFGSNQHQTSSSPFVQPPVGAGNYYVTDPNYQVGPLANISPSLLFDLEKMTTFPPTVVANQTISSPPPPWDQTVARESGYAPLMLGYHYPALDYLVSQVNVQNTTLTLGQGVAVGVYGGYGLYSFTDSTLISQGTPLMHNQLCWYPAVQEQPVALGSGYLMEWTGYEPPSSLNAQFTDFNGMSGMLGLVDGIDCQIQLSSCNIGPGYFSPSSPPGLDGITNNLFERVNLYIDTFDWECPVYLYNNTFIHSTVQINDYWHVSNYRTIKDNLFDQSTLTVPYPGDVNYGYNAYSGGSTALSPPHQGDFNLNTLVYASGPLGNRYIDPSTSPTLVNAGSRSAYDAGLYYYYTILTNQTPDEDSGNGNVSIGFHYYVLPRPYASPASTEVCRGNAVPVTLYGSSPNTPNNEVVSYIILTPPQHGTLSGTAPNLTYTADPNYVGQDTFTYETFDGYLDSPPATVAITVGDSIPQAYDLRAITQVGQPVTLILEGSDICDDPLTFSISPGSGPANGQLGTLTQIDPTHASVIYTPNPGYQGQDSFQFTIDDGVGTDSASVQISVVSGPVVLVSVNFSGGGGIHTYNFSDGSEINSFVPASENGYNDPGVDGRGLAIDTTATGTEIFYTQVGYVFGGPQLIHVCSYGTDGSGSVADSRTLQSPDQRMDANGDLAGIAALAIHFDPAQGKNELYALTGYGLDSPYHPDVYELDPANGNIIAGPVSIPTTPADPEFGTYTSSDGFTVLTNGDFLINDYDGPEGDAIYREYYGFNAPAGKTPGTLVSGGLQIDVSSFSSDVGFSIGGGVGVTCALDGSLYFMVYEYYGIEGFNNTAVVHTDSNGNYISSGPVFSINAENIAVVIPQ